VVLPPVRDELVTGPVTADEPLSVARVKGYRRITHSLDDADILDLIRAARGAVEREFRRALAPQTRRLWVDAFGLFGQPIFFPVAPVTAVTSVEWRDALGVWQTLLPSAYELVAGDGAYVRPTTSGVWPSVAFDERDSIRIVYTAGFTAATLPPEVPVALQLLVGDYYEHRETIVTGPVSRLPGGISALLDGLIWSPA
jgi:uncharacterized phiE125 gp8 family phage protein